jgi:hypothetical protein
LSQRQEKGQYQIAVFQTRKRTVDHLFHLYWKDDIESTSTGYHQRGQPGNDKKNIQEGRVPLASQLPA